MKQSKAPKRKWSSVSYSYRHRASMPGKTPALYKAAPNVRMGFKIAENPLIREQFADMRLTEAQRRRKAIAQRNEAQSGSQMVKDDKPQPVLKPSPVLALGPDASAFNRRWAEERLRAINAFKQDRRKLVKTSANLDALAERTKAVDLTPGKAGDLERAFFIEKRRAAQAMRRSRKRTRKIT